MTVVIADRRRALSLARPPQTIEVRDVNGHLLGLFIPVVDPSSDPRLTPTISEEELQRREQSGGGRPLAHILVDLEKTA